MELEGLRDAQLVDELGHELGVGFEGNKGWSALLRVWVCRGGHGVAVWFKGVAALSIG